MAGDYLEEHRQRVQREQASTLVEGLVRVGNFRGTLAELAHAMAKAGVVIDFQFAVTTLCSACDREAATLQSRGITVVLHDDGHDVEVIAPEKEA